MPGETTPQPRSVPDASSTCVLLLLGLTAVFGLKAILRQAGVILERRFIFPVRMNVE